MGILNKMGTSVLERTRKIGTRKEFGVTERDILLEAGLIRITDGVSITGGVLGLLIGGLASVALALATGFPLIFVAGQHHRCPDEH